MTSLKKCIAAVAASLPLVASAQQAAAPAPLYQIYGSLNLNMQYIEVSKPTNPNPLVTPAAPGRNMTGRFALSTDSSNVGIRGTADTGQFGLGVVYQCETSANLDGEGPSGICNRNSRIGVSGGFGTLFYGNWDSPYKALLYGTKADDPFGNTDVYDAAAIIGSPGFYTRSSGGRSTGGTTANTLASFNQRAGNSVAYHSPKFMGAQLKAQYSANEFQNRAGSIAPALYSVGLNYDLGAISAAVAYERHDDYSGVDLATGALAAPTRSTTDQGIKAGAGIELGSGFGTTTVGAQGEYLKYANAHTHATGDFDNASRWAYLIGLKHRTGDHEFRARWMQAMDLDVKLKGVTITPNPGKNTGAQSIAVGYAFYLSKAAQVYAFAHWLMNDKNATYTFATGGPAKLTDTAGTGSPELWTAGADPFAAGLGIRYAF
jgi:predicted porin